MNSQAALDTDYFPALPTRRKQSCCEFSTAIPLIADYISLKKSPKPPRKAQSLGAHIFVRFLIPNAGPALTLTKYGENPNHMISIHNPCNFCIAALIT